MLGYAAPMGSALARLHAATRRLFAAALACVAAGGVAQERVLVERRSPYGLVTVVEDASGLRALYFDGGVARQSAFDPRDPDHLESRYAQAVPLAFALAQGHARMLVVGLGVGIVPSFLRRRMPQLEVDAVELDPVVVEVARSHFGFREDAHLRAHVGDGRRFVERCRDRYDVVLLDAFGADSVPYALATREFLEAVRRVVAPGGVAVGNVWGRERNTLYDAMLATYRAVFDEVWVLELEGAVNKLVFAFPGREGLARERVVARARELSARLALRHDLGALVERGFRPPGRDGEGARVLLDRDAPR